MKIYHVDSVYFTQQIAWCHDQCLVMKLIGEIAPISHPHKEGKGVWKKFRIGGECQLQWNSATFQKHVAPCVKGVE